MPDPTLAEVLHEVRALLETEARGAKRMVTLSPETAAALDALADTPAAGAAQEKPGTSRAVPEASRPADAPGAAAGVQPKAAPAPAAKREAYQPALAIDAPPEVPAGVTLDTLAETVAACTKCGLCQSRTQTVFGVGNPRADLVFVGEAPGFEEDRRGEPFVGRAGKLLTDIITKGMKMQREAVYICNVLKCRPPDNRNPSPEEVAQCEPYLLQQLALVQPKVICALGSYAAQTLLRSTESVGRLRGRWHSYHGIPLRVTYHPAYLLRNERDKGKTWEDIQEVMKRLGLPLK